MKFSDKHISHMEFGKLYFYTVTISNWNSLMCNDDLKFLVLNSLRYLSLKKMMNVYGFVIMPNHLHLIWQMLSRNGKESPQGSFLKFTSHEFKKYLIKNDPGQLGLYSVDRCNKSYEFWQRDPYAFELYNKNTAMQKLDYIHTNPVKPYWSLCESKLDYKFSSARFYETNVDEFGFLSWLADYF